MNKMEYIRKTYGVVAFRGDCIRHKGRMCKILSAVAGRLHVLDIDTGRKMFLHPTWEIEYSPLRYTRRAAR